MIFLIEYDRQEGVLVAIESFSEQDRRRAAEARLSLEVDLLHSGVDHEVVLLEAPDQEALQRTHRRYFASLQELATPV